MNIEEIYTKYESVISIAIDELNENGDYDEHGTIALVKLNYNSSEYDNILDYLELAHGMGTGDYDREGGWRLIGLADVLNEEEILKLFSGVAELVKVFSIQELWLNKNCKNGFEKHSAPSDIAGLKNGDDEYIGEVKEGKANGRGIYNWKIGYQYLGDWVDDKPQGSGVLIYPDNRKYEGDFLNGKREGKGRLYWPNGDIYEGDFLGGRMEGKAEKLFLNGTTFFEGSYLENFSEGEGILRSKNGDLYKGDFKKGKRNGQGIYLWADGRVYVGDFLNGTRTGSAIFIRGMTVTDEYKMDYGHPLVLEKIPESVRQVGGDWIIYFEYQKNYLDPSKVVAYRDGDNWYNDKAVKVCDINFPYKNHKLLNDAADGKIGPLGNLYDGEWKDGKYHGIGMFTWISNDGTSYYEGSWRLGKRTGKGIYIFKNGQKYEGDFIDNKRTGKGTLKYSDSDDRKEYVGDWIDGKRDGKGTMTWKTGDEKGANGNKRFLNIYVGEWKDDKQHGKGKMTYENSRSPKYDYGPIGGVYDGEWEMGERNGIGMFTSEDGWAYQGSWKEGRRHGKGVITYDNGKKEEAIWINDAKGGSFKEQFKEFIIRNKDAFEENSDFLKIEIYFSKEYSLKLKYLQGQSKGDVVYNLHELCEDIKDFINNYDSIFENYFNKLCKEKEISSILFSDRLDDGDIEFDREFYFQSLEDGL
jgi:hypothetical protein